MYIRTSTAYINKEIEIPREILPPTKKSKNKSLPPTASKPHQPASSSDRPKSEVKSLASKTMDTPQKSATVGKLRSKPKAPDSPTPAKSTGTKRHAGGKEVELKDNKRSKKKLEFPTESLVKTSTLSGGESKKMPFQRLWSEDDEIAILEGMVEYDEKKRSDPMADLDAFHDFIKKKLHVDVGRAQFQDKVRKMKKKYENKKIKEECGEGNSFSKPHDQKTYELSKIVWGIEKEKATGVENVVVSAARKNPSRKVNVVKDGHSKEVRNLEKASDELAILGSKRSIPNIESEEERILRLGTEFFEGDKKLKGAREWIKLRQEGVELHLKKLELLCAQTKLVLDVLKFTHQ